MSLILTLLASAKIISASLLFAMHTHYLIQKISYRPSLCLEVVIDETFPCQEHVLFVYKLYKGKEYSILFERNWKLTLFLRLCFLIKLKVLLF